MEHLRSVTDLQCVCHLDLPTNPAITSGVRQAVAHLVEVDLVQRLKMVSQAGAPALVGHHRAATRYDHSVGVAQLATALGFPVADQCAALLHDATHAAFSHTVDYLLNDPTESTHDRQFGRLSQDRQLVAVLGTAKLTQITEIAIDKPQWLRVLDSFDYTLRDLAQAGRLGDDERIPIGALTTVDGRVAFCSTDDAVLFMNLMLRAAVDLYLDPLDLYRHQELARILQMAIGNHLLTLADLLTGTDHLILTTLRSDPGTCERLERLLTTGLSDLRPDPDAPPVTSKPRVFAPLVVTENQPDPLPVTELASEASFILDQARLVYSQDRHSLVPIRPNSSP